MTSVVDKREKFARRRAAHERTLLNVISARVNHDPRARLLAASTATRTLHHGCDLSGVIAKTNMLQVQHLFHQDRFLFGRCENGAVLLVRMPDNWYCLCDWDDFVYPLDELPVKILETSLKLGIWEAADDA